MTKYCRIEGETVVEVFDFNPFEWIPNKSFLANCMECPDETKVGWVHKNGEFVALSSKNPPELREQTYETMTIKNDGTTLISWEGQAITVDQANKVYLEYSAEGSIRAAEMQALIISAKTYIRGLYPDVE